jgi:hypothetical protein
MENMWHKKKKGGNVKLNDTENFAQKISDCPSTQTVNKIGYIKEQKNFTHLYYQYQIHSHNV